MQRCLLFGDALPSGLATADSMQYSLIVTGDENGREDEDKIQDQLAVVIGELASSILRSFDAKVREREWSWGGASLLANRLVRRVVSSGHPNQVASRG